MVAAEQQANPEAYQAIEIVPRDYLAQLNLSELFPNADAAFEVDLGSGYGTLVLSMAAAHPDRNYLAVERQLERVRSLCRKAHRKGLKNLRVLHLEIAYTVNYLLPPGSVSILHLMFPDPWPKRRHHKRRLVCPDFLNAAHRALAPLGELRFATDYEPYFTASEALLLADVRFHRAEWPVDQPYLQTDFERIFSRQGKDIYRLRLIKGRL